MLTDPISDMITRIRNAYMRGKEKVSVPGSQFKASILDALVREGYIRGYTENTDGHKVFNVELKYFNGKSVIQQIKRISKPSLRFYSSLRNMKLVANGLGNAILSTSFGVLSDREAKGRGVGGEILITVR